MEIIGYRDVSKLFEKRRNNTYNILDFNKNQTNVKSAICQPKLSDFQVCRSGEIGFAFHRAGIYKKDVVSSSARGLWRMRNGI